MLRQDSEEAETLSILKNLPITETVRTYGRNSWLNEEEVLAFLSVCKREELLLILIDYASWEIRRGDTQAVLVHRLEGWSCTVISPQKKHFGHGWSLPDIVNSLKKHLA